MLSRAFVFLASGLMTATIYAQTTLVHDTREGNLSLANPYTFTIENLSGSDILMTGNVQIAALAGGAVATLRYDSTGGTNFAEVWASGFSVPHVDTDSDGSHEPGPVDLGAGLVLPAGATYRFELDVTSGALGTRYNNANATDSNLAMATSSSRVGLYSFEYDADYDPGSEPGGETLATLVHETKQGNIVMADPYTLTIENLTGGDILLNGNAYLAAYNSDATATIRFDPAGGSNFSEIWAENVAVPHLDTDSNGKHEAGPVDLGASLLLPAGATYRFELDAVSGNLGTRYSPTGVEDENLHLVTPTNRVGFYQLDYETNVTSLNSEQIAARFLHQATFGPTHSSITDLAAEIDANGEMAALEAWIDQQFAEPASTLTDFLDNVVIPNSNWGYDTPMAVSVSAWLNDALDSTDQLRGRVNYLLSQILVIGESYQTRPQKGNLDYYDMLGSHAFGNYRDLLYDVALHPRMGNYLSHLRNAKADPLLNTQPDENFAREIMQLFSIGLFMLDEDGTRLTDGAGNDIPTYTNTEITEFAEVFTGLTFGGTQPTFKGFFNTNQEWFEPMAMWDEYHDTSEKVLLNYPGAVNGGVRDAWTDDPAVDGEGLADIDFAIDNLFKHPNVGPFLARLMIQHLVTSNPTPDYVGRVAAKFANNGQGVRGDMKAVIKAILLDPEAREGVSLDDVAHGRLDEQYMRTVRLGRALDLYEAGGEAYIKAYSASQRVILGLEPMRSPSVFNFFLPDFQPAGPIQDNNLVGPEFEIYTDLYATTTMNVIKQISEFGWPGYGNDPTIDITPLLDLESTGGDQAVVDRLDLLLCRGLMSPETETIILDAIDDLTDPTEKIQLAIYLTSNSAESAVLR